MLSDNNTIGIIGGSGFYSLLSDPEIIDIETPYGKTSEKIAIGTLNGKNVAFIPRHGNDHRFTPALVPYRANMWALKSLSINKIISLSAVGSLDNNIHPGTFIVPDQIVDRTKNRISTFCTEEKGAIHVSLADPYCENSRVTLAKVTKKLGYEITNSGTMVVIEGPRFSTRAESKEYQNNGWSVIGMTAMPEAILAKELAMCYCTLSLVTDYDAGVNSGEGVTQQEVLELFSKNLERMKEIVFETVGEFPEGQETCDCGKVFETTPQPYWMPKQ